MKVNPLAIFSSCLIVLILGGVSALTYFFIDHAGTIKTISNQKADLSQTYDRATFDSKIISKRGPKGPKGPKGPSASAAKIITIETNSLFSDLEKLQPGAAVFLKFTKNFRPTSFMQTDFMGAVIATNKNQVIMFGETIDVYVANFKGVYKIIAERNAEDQIKWTFLQKTIQELNDYYTQALTDAKLATKIDDKTAYTKSRIDYFLALKMNKADTYSKTQVDQKIASVPPEKLSYSTKTVDEKLATKVEQTAAYTNTEINHKILGKISKGDNYYTKPEIDAKLNTKVNKVDTYSKTEIDTFFNQPEKKRLYNWTKFVKVDLPNKQITSTMYGDLNFAPDGKYLNAAKTTDTLQLKSTSQTFHKGDRLSIRGFAKTNIKTWQGILVMLKNKNGSHAGVHSFKHWNRSYINNVFVTEMISQDFSSDASYAEKVRTYPLVVFRNNNQGGYVKDYFRFEINLEFNDDYIYVSSRTTSGNANGISICDSFALLTYPTTYNDSDGLFIEYLENAEINGSTGQTVYSDPVSILSGHAEINFIRDWSNREFNNKINYETRSL